MAIIPQSFYETYLTSSISAAASTIPVATCPATGVTTGFITIGSEIIKFEGNSNPGGAGNLTSCTRGLALSGTTETTAGLGVAHAAGVSVKIADVHYYMNNAAAALALTTTGTPVANDYTQFTAAGIVQGRSYAEVKADLDLEIGTDVLAQQTIGIADNNLVEIDHAAVADNDYAKFTANGLEGRSYSEVLSDIGAAATAQTFYIGTTQVAINRASAALTLAGITLTTPNIGTPSAGTLTSCTGLPAAGVVNTAATLTDTQTLTNKRITKRVTTTTDDATAVIDIDTCDEYELSAVANATEFTLTGTPTDGQTLIVRIKDAGASKALTWTGFTAIGVTLPAATTISKWHYIGCKYNSAASAWHAIAVGVQA